MSKQFLAIVVVIILIFVGIFAISGHKSSSSKAATGTLTQHVEGLGQDHVTLVEYGDYQCPYCGEYYSTVKSIETEYNSQITFQFRNFPLTSIHQNAFAGSRAAEAAGLMGKFWQMHDLLYEENQVYYDANETGSSWISSSSPLTYFDQFAKELGLNVTTFNADYSSDKVNDLINADMNKGNQLGIDATPTFYLDGKQVQPADSVSAFQSLINKAIKTKAATATTTTTTSNPVTTTTSKS